MSNATVLGIRALADFFEAHPEQLPSGVTVNLYPGTKEKFQSFLKAAGSVTKEYREAHDLMWARKDFGGGVGIDCNIARSKVCERVLVETRIIPEHVIPASAETVVPAHEEPVYEWRCGSVLAGASDLREASDE
jgi:hypothetical protein